MTNEPSEPLYAEFPDQKAPIDELLPNDQPEPYGVAPEEAPAPSTSIAEGLAAASAWTEWGHL